MKLIVSFAIFLFMATAQASPIDLCFEPGPGSCTDKIVTALAKAKTKIRVQAYSFTSQPIADALIAAAKRKVDVQVIQDLKESQDQYSMLPKLIAAGVPCTADKLHAIAHNKVMVIDGKITITGSFNFTNAAEKRNAENLLVINNNTTVAAAYEANWNTHKTHAIAYAPAPAVLASPVPVAPASAAKAAP